MKIGDRIIGKQKLLISKDGKAYDLFTPYHIRAIEEIDGGWVRLEGDTTIWFKLNDFKPIDQKEEFRKIIGYKAPCDLFGGNIKKDTLYRCTSSNPTPTLMYAPIKDNLPIEGFKYNLPKEIVEQWERVYEEKFKVDDWITIKYSTDLQDGCKGCPSGTFQIVNEFSGKGLLNEEPGFVVKTFEGNWRISEIGVRKATDKEIQDNIRKEIRVGKIKFFVNSKEKTAECGFGKVTKEEIEKVINYIKYPPKLCGYTLSISFNDGDYKILSELDSSKVLSLGFGCQFGKLSELEELYKAFDE